VKVRRPLGLPRVHAVLACLALLAFVTSPACRRPPALADLVVVNPVGDRPTFFDFGRVPFGPPVEHVFRIRNDGHAPVTIRDVLPSCSCTSSKISYVAQDGSRVAGDTTSREHVITLPTGVVADLVVKIDTTRIERMNVDKLTQVRLRSDSGTTPFLTFEQHVVVARAMIAVPASIDLGATPRSVGKSGRADVMVDDLRTSYRVLGVETIEGPFTVTLDETTVANVPTWTLVASAKPGLPFGPVSGAVHLSISGEGGDGTSPSFRIPVTAQVVEDVVARPPVLSFGAIPRGSAADAEGEIVALVPGERVRVIGTKISAQPESVAGSLRVETEPESPNDEGRAMTWKIRLHASESLAEPQFSGMLVIALDHPVVAAVRVPFSGTTR
jgi:hypothetical protein